VRLKIYVCIKHVPDSGATITVEAGCRINENVTYLINPYDEHAVTEAVKLKAAHPGGEVVAVCLGPATADETLRSAMAMGADRAVLIVSGHACDSIVAARALAAAIDADGRPDLILAGRESIDSEGMQTHFRLAENLGVPIASNVVKLDVTGGSAVVACEREAGTVDVIRMTLPCAAAVGKGINTPRYPTFPDIVKARKKEVKKIALDALGLESPGGKMRLRHLAPAVEERQPKEISGSAAEVARQIVEILKTEAKII
jgi:electron transfer flavoprotein beta subunit